MAYHTERRLTLKPNDYLILETATGYLLRIIPGHWDSGLVLANWCDPGPGTNVALTAHEGTLGEVTLTFTEEPWPHYPSEDELDTLAQAADRRGEYPA